MNSTKIFNFFNNPRTALFIMIFFLLAYFLSEGLTVGFGNNFLTFGPTTDSNTGEPTLFMGIKLSTWSSVITVYFIIFISTILQSYYYNVMDDTLHSFVFNPAVDTVPFSKLGTYLIYMINPFVNIILYIINFYAVATFQIQYIIPQFIASYIVNLPFTFKWLSGKKFIG